MGRVCKEILNGYNVQSDLKWVESEKGFQMGIVCKEIKNGYSAPKDCKWV